MTGAGSRKAFMNELTLRLGSGQSVQFICFTLQNLTDANLRWGYKVGDALLYEVANHFKSSDCGVQIFRTNNVGFTMIPPEELGKYSQEKVK